MPGPQAVTEELRRWIVAQAEAGCSADGLMAAMRAGGWDEAVATQALETTLTEHLRSLGRPVPVVAEAAAVPEPALQDKPSVVCVDGREIAVLATLQSPRLVVFGQLLSDEECDALVALAQPRLERSQTVAHATGGSEVNAARTSDGMFFRRGETSLIERIEQRIAGLLHWPVDHGEGLQVLRYRPGAEYRPHHDYFDPSQPGTAAVLRRGGQRLATLVMYLNTPEQGGATTFPEAGLEVAAVKGNAVFFSYPQPDPASRTLHGGAPVLAGEKWVATKWLRQGVFV